MRSLGSLIEPRRRGEVKRTPAEQAEIARRVAIYAAQYARTGRLRWLPHRNTEPGCTGHGSE